MDESARNGVREFKGQGLSLSRLPKKVRLLGEVPGKADCLLEPSAGLFEFEVVTGNAAYKEGEHFYLTPAQARRAYLSVQHP